MLFENESKMPNHTIMILFGIRKQKQSKKIKSLLCQGSAYVQAKRTTYVFQKILSWKTDVFLLGFLKDITGDYRVAFLFLGFSQMLGAMMALQAILYRKHNCTCKSPKGEDIREDRRRSQEALLSDTVKSPITYENFKDIGSAEVGDVNEIDIREDNEIMK